MKNNYLNHGKSILILVSWSLLLTSFVNKSDLFFNKEKSSKNPKEVIFTGAEITFNTNNEDKDWDTRPFADLYINGQNIAHLDCCTSDRSGDNWTNGSSVTKSLNVISKVSKNSLLRDGICVLGAQGGTHGAGNDTWKTDASLRITYSDGSSTTHGGDGWNNLEFYSRGRSHESTNAISLRR